MGLIEAAKRRRFIETSSLFTFKVLFTINGTDPSVNVRSGIQRFHCMMIKQNNPEWHPERNCLVKLFYVILRVDSVTMTSYCVKEE